MSTSLRRLPGKAVGALRKRLAGRGIANILAGVVFLAVIIAGLSVIDLDRHIGRPVVTTVVSRPAAPARKSSRTSTKVVRGPKGRARVRTKVTIRATASAVPASTESTTVTGSRSAVERLIGDGGDVFLQIGLILIAAYIAAAAIQRVLVGQFGGLKFGSIQINELVNTSDAVTANLQDALTTFQDESSAKLSALAKELTKLTEQTNTVDSELSHELAVLTTRLAAVEAKLKSP